MGEGNAAALVGHLGAETFGLGRHGDQRRSLRSTTSLADSDSSGIEASHYARRSDVPESVLSAPDRSDIGPHSLRATCGRAGRWEREV